MITVGQIEGLGDLNEVDNLSRVLTAGKDGLLPDVIPAGETLCKDKYQSSLNFEIEIIIDQECADPAPLINNICWHVMERMKNIDGLRYDGSRMDRPGDHRSSFGLLLNYRTVQREMIPADTSKFEGN